MLFVLATLLSNTSAFFCSLHCTEHYHDCVENDQGLTKAFAKCSFQYGLCMDGCVSESSSDSSEDVVSPGPLEDTFTAGQAPNPEASLGKDRKDRKPRREREPKEDRAPKEDRSEREAERKEKDAEREAKREAAREQRKDRREPLADDVCVPLERVKKDVLQAAITWVCSKGGMKCNPDAPPADCRAEKKNDKRELERLGTYVFSEYYSQMKAGKIAKTAAGSQWTKAGAAVCDPRVAYLTKKPKDKECVFPGAMKTATPKFMEA